MRPLALGDLHLLAAVSVTRLFDVFENGLHCLQSTMTMCVNAFGRG